MRARTSIPRSYRWASELLAHRGIGADIAGRHFDGGDGERGQGNGAAGGQAFHQHAPALAHAALAADDAIERHENVRAGDRPVGERHAHGIVQAADFDARRIAGNEGAGDAGILVGAQQAIRVMQIEGEADHSGHRSQRDIALVEIDGTGDFHP
jgi:hypothetical protein